MPDIHSTGFSLFDGSHWDPYADPIDPSPITVEALAKGLALTFRFRGQTKRPLPVDEHMLRVKWYTKVIRGDDHGDLYALLHDAHEALTPWGDVPTHCKTPWMREVEARIDIAIFAALGIDAPDPAIVYHVKLADRMALRTEALLWGPRGSSSWVPDVPREIAALHRELLLPEPIEGQWDLELGRALARAKGMQ